MINVMSRDHMAHLVLTDITIKIQLKNVQDNPQTFLLPCLVWIYISSALPLLLLAAWLAA